MIIQPLNERIENYGDEGMEVSLGGATNCSEENGDEDGDESDPPELGDTEYIASREEVFDAIEEAFKKDKNLSTKLLNYALKEIFIRTGKNEINGIRADDLYQNSLQDIIEGRRRWRRNRTPDIVNLMYMAILSNVRNEFRKIIDAASDKEDSLIDKSLDNQIDNHNKVKKRKYRPVVIPFYTKNDSGEYNEYSEYDKEAGEKFCKDDLDKDEVDFEEIIRYYEEKLEDDEEAFFVFQERLEGNKSNIEIANKLGISVKEVENAMKRIKRLISRS